MDLSCIIQSGDLELYVMGMLPPEEADKVEVLAQLFPEIKLELAAIADTFETAAMQIAVTPSTSVKEKIMASLPVTRDRQSTYNSNNPSAKVIDINVLHNTKSSFSKIAVAASWGLLVLLGALSVYLFTNNNKLKNDVVLLQKNANIDEQQKVELNLKLSYFEIYHRLKKDAAVTSVALASVKEGVQQQAEVFWNKTTGELYIDPSLLPQTPGGKQYQLWFILDGKPVDAGMLSLNSTLSIQKMKECKSAQMFAITLEDKGGKPTPTMDQLIVAGKVG